MIPFFHASGRFNYAKSAAIYLADMKKVDMEFERESAMDPEEYERFTKGGCWTCQRTVKFFAGIFTDQTIEQTLMRILKIEGGLFKRGVTDSVAFQWLQAFIYIKDVILGMERFTKVACEKSFQHKDASDSRIKIDNETFDKFVQFLEQFHPFCEDDSDKIINVANGMTSDGVVNCHEAFKEGFKIMTSIADKQYDEVKLSKSNWVKTMRWSSNLVMIGDRELPIDQNHLLHRACLQRKNEGDMKENLTFELAKKPLQFYDKFEMLKNQKSELLTIFSTADRNVKDDFGACFVIDGGHLLHRVKMIVEKKFEDIIQDYVKYLQSNYNQHQNKILVVFDGYETPTIKSAERDRRAKYATSAPIQFTKEMKLKISSEKFLHSNENKSKFIKMLMEAFKEQNIESIQCQGDADRTIVKEAIKIATANPTNTVIIVAEDTDVAILMTALTPYNLEIFMFKPQKGKVDQKTFSSRSLDHLDRFTRDNIFFIHAASGCDTVSATRGFGKLALFKVLKDNIDLWENVKKFKESDKSAEELMDHIIQIYLAMHKAPLNFRKPDVPSQLPIELAEEHRYRMYLAGILKKTKFELGKIISTVDALEQHMKKIYLQVQYWIHGEENCSLNPTDWGWKLVNGTYEPISMTRDPAPAKLLVNVSCGCKTGCGARCGCRKNGISCTLACKVCQGTTCSNNSSNFVDEIDDDENDMDAGMFDDDFDEYELVDDNAMNEGVADELDLDDIANDDIDENVWDW